MIDLSRNENPYGPSPSVKKAIRACLKELNRYNSQLYSSQLIDKISEVKDIPKESIILGQGAKGILVRLSRYYNRDKGNQRKVLLPEVSWKFYGKLAKNWQIDRFKLNPDFSFNVDSILEKISEYKPQMVLIPSPNNPTGISLTNQEIKAIIKNCPDETIFILDRAYAGFKPEEELFHLVILHPNFGIVCSFSKYFALAGLRVGYGVLGEKIRKKLGIDGYSREVESYLGQLSTPQALGALAVLAPSSQEYYSRISKKIVEQREMMYKEINKLPGFKAYPSDANCLLIKVPKDRMSKLIESLAANQIKIKFEFDNYVRVGIGLDEENQKLLKVLRSI